MPNPSLPLLTENMPIMQTDDKGNILTKNRLLQKDRRFSARRSVGKALSDKDRQKLSVMTNGTSRAVSFSLDTDFSHDTLLSPPAYYTAFVLAGPMGLTWYMPHALQTNYLLSGEELNSFGIPSVFAESLHYLHHFPKLTLPTLLSHSGAAVFREGEDLSFLSFIGIVETICRLLWEEDVLTVDTALSDLIAESPQRALTSLGKLLPHIAENPQTQVALKIQDDGAFFKRKGVRIPIGMVREKAGVSLLRPFFFTKDEAASAILFASLSEFFIKLN